MIRLKCNFHHNLKKLLAASKYEIAREMYTRYDCVGIFIQKTEIRLD
jgi:hypothetical protein